MKPINKYALNFGLLAFLYYAVATIITYQFFGEHNALFSTAYMVSYVLFLALLCFFAWYYKYKVNSEVAMKELFRLVFIAIILGELGLAITQYLFVTQWNPTFFDSLYRNTKAWMDANSGWSEEQKATMLENINNQKNVPFKSLFSAYAQSLIKDSIVAMIFIFIIKRPSLKNRLPQTNSY